MQFATKKHVVSNLYALEEPKHREKREYVWTFSSHQALKG